MFKERIILVSIITVVLLLVSGLFLPKMESEKIQFRKYWAFKTHRKDKHDIIIMGDSRAYRGISPSEMQKALPNYRILNFGYSSGNVADKRYVGC